MTTFPLYWGFARRAFTGASFALACMIIGSNVHAQTWLGPVGTGGYWSNTANWVGGATPTNDGAANVIFSQSNSSASSVLDKNWNVASVLFNPTPGQGSTGGVDTQGVIAKYSLGATTLTVQQGITNTYPGAISILPTINVAQAQTWDTGSGGLIVYGLSGTGQINKINSGTLTIEGTQSAFNGGFNVTAGMIYAAGGGACLGADGTSVQLAGATVELASAPLSYPATAFSFNHPLMLGTGGGSLETLSATTTFNGAVSGGGGLTMATAVAYSNVYSSSYVLGGTNTYAGGTTVGGSVTLMTSGTAQALGTGNVIVQSGGALVLASASNLAPGCTVALQSSTASQYASALVLVDSTINPGAVVSKASTGGVVALGSYTYNTPLDFSVIGNGKLAFGAGGSAVYAAATLGAGSDGVYRLGGGTSTGSLTIDGGANVLTGSRSVVIGDYGVFQGGSVTTGSTYSAVTLPNANNYTGGTALNSGTLLLGNDQALGSGTLTLGYATLQANGSPRTLANPLVMNSAGGYLHLTGTNGFTFTGTVDLGGGSKQFNFASVPTTFTNVISDGSLQIVGGPVTLAAANTFSALTVNTSTVYVATDANLGVAGSTLTLGGGIIVPFEASLTINRPVVVSGDGSAISTNGGVVTINGAVTGNTNVSLTKKGAGTLVLTSPSSTEAMSVSAGTLQMDNSVAGKPGNAVQVTLTGGTLAGVGPVGYTSVSNGHIAPGDNGPGTLTIDSGLLLFDGVIFDYDLGTNGSDELIINGHLFQIQIDNNQPYTFNFTDAGGLTPGQTYKLIDWGTTTTSGVSASAFQLGSSPVGGTFSVQNNALYFTTAAYTPFQQWQYTYFGSINNASAAPTANPAGDGITNLIKYALGLDPRFVSTASLPKVGMTNSHLTLTYNKPVSVTDITYDPQFSDDLANWSDNGVNQQTLSNDGTTQTVQAAVALGASGHRFLRLSVSSQ